MLHTEASTTVVPEPRQTAPKDPDNLDGQSSATEKRVHSIALRGHSTNLVGLPTDLLGSMAFNTHPRPLHIHGTRESHSSLFTKLPRAQSLVEAGAMFQDYMQIVFGFEPERHRTSRESGRRRFRSSYLGLLQDWGFDSNNPQGAVLKGWAESRFGLFPTYHKAALSHFSSREWMRYVEEKMNSHYHNNCIFLQLDLLFEFCQWAFQRFALAGGSHLRLYRGIDTLQEFDPVGPPNPIERRVRLNNVVSFTRSKAIATEFGAYVLEAQVPTVKLTFFNELLPRHALRGEAEFIAIGGDYLIRLSR